MSETASENLMDDRFRKWEDRRRLEREGDEIIKVLVQHEEQEAVERRRKRKRRDGQEGDGQNGRTGKG